MKNLMDFLMQNKDIHEYRLKFAFEPSADQLDCLKKKLSKYDLIDFGPVQKTIFQTKPLDFYHLDCGEIYMIDVQLERPTTQDLLAKDVSALMKVSESLVVVRDKNEPLEIEHSKDLDLDEEYESILMDPDYKEAESIDPKELCGDEYTDEMVKAVVDHAKSDGGAYKDFMSASFSFYYPKAASDVPKDQGPVKE